MHKSHLSKILEIASKLEVALKVGMAKTITCNFCTSICRKLPFQALTPTENAEDIKTYVDAMDFACSPKNKDVRNIAVTGQYGAGKSSFLRTYFKNKKNVLWVSLALFLDQVDKEKEEGDFTHKLELSILQQMFHVRKESTFWCWKVIIIVALLGVGVIGIKQPDVFVRYVSSPIHLFVAEYAVFIFWLSCIEVSAVSIWALRSIILWLKSLGVKRIEVNGAGVAELGIEMPEKSSFSVLNQNVRTIISFFAETRYTTVIFEDIDRFDDLRIFTKLRELNLLLNNSQQIKNRNKPIRFVYALREELFKDEKNKVKFFDLLIPIIPRINASNSRTELLSFLKDWNDTPPDELLKRFVKEVSPYISDLRLLKNICNEYYTYKKQIVDFTSEKELLGLIVFKNFFPKDFALMHNGKGLIRKMMDIKKNAQISLRDGIEKRIKDLKEELAAIRAEKLCDIKQLQSLYYTTLMKRFNSNYQYVYIDGCQCYITSIIHHDDWFEMLRSNKMSCGYYGRDTIKWEDIEGETDSDATYEERVSRIESYKNGRVEKIKQEIQVLHDKCLTIKRKNFQELISEGAIKESKIREVIKKSSNDCHNIELMLLLLKKGYFNETYHYNITVFREVDGVNSIVDYQFELDVTKGVDVDWAFRLNNPSALVESIDLHYFSTSSIMNYDICNDLLSNPVGEKAQAFWGLISNKEKRSYEFVNGYINEEKFSDDADKLFDCIMIANPKYIDGLVELAYSEEIWPRTFVEKQLGLYFSWVLRQGSVIKIAPMVKEYLDETSSFPLILKENEIDDAGQMEALVKMFGLKFKTLDFKSAKETGFLDVVICNNAYEINEVMILGLLKSLDLEVGQFKTKNYSLIRECGVNAIVNYVDSEFQQYLGRVYARLDSMQEDDDATILHVLNREDLSDDDKGRFINKQTENGRIRNAKALNTEKALSLAVKLNWVVPSWNNAAEIWNRDKDDISLFWEYVGREECYSCLATKNSRGISWDKDQNWAKRFVEEKNLSDEAMNCLLSGMAKGVIHDYTGTNATSKRIEYLVKGDRIRYSSSLYENLKGLNNDSHIVLAALCINEFCNTYTDGDITVSDAMKLLASEFLDSRYYVLVINTLKEIITENEELRRVVAQEVNVGNFNKIDEQVLGTIVEYVKLESLQCKIIQHIGGTVIEIRERLKMMPEPYSKLGDKGCRPLIPRWNGLEEFLEFLKNKGVVSSFVLADDGKMQVNTTRS